MTRYFFHLTGDVLSEDRVGEEFPTPEAAAAAGREVARDIAQNRSESEMHDWKLCVTDDSGAEIAVIAIADGQTATRS
jgi:hypothetical protein